MLSWSPPHDTITSRRNRTSRKRILVLRGWLHKRVKNPIARSRSSVSFLWLGPRDTIEAQEIALKRMTAGLLAVVFSFTCTAAIAERPDSDESLQNTHRNSVVGDFFTPVQWTVDARSGFSVRRVQLPDNSRAIARTSLCSADETVYFNCAVKNGEKVVSLCGTKGLSRNEGYLQYRFGRPGHIDLEYPKAREDTRRAFFYAHYFRALVDLSEISFTIDKYRYSIFDHVDSESKPSKREAGVQVTTADDGSTTTLVCRGAPTSRLAALANVLPCDKESGLNISGCSQ
jgi:hypothetical protein